jgi:NADPH2:quinone reductase
MHKTIRHTGRERRSHATDTNNQSSTPLMRAAAIEHFGPPSVLKLRNIPIPKVGPNEVLIAVHAAGVGVWDGDILGGWWPSGKPKFPVVLGTDGAGIISKVGSRVQRFKEGDRVWAYQFINPKGGFYAESTAVNADNVGFAPARLDMLHAGAAAVTGLTAFQGIHEHLKVSAGETTLVFGASGAVGTLAVQFARRLNAHVIGAARGSDAADLVRRLGANEVVDLREKDFIDKLHAMAPKGIDAVLACAGGETLERCLDLVHPDGRVAYPNGIDPEPGRRPGIHFKSYDAKAGASHFEELKQTVDGAGLEVPIAASVPLEKAKYAHELLERGHVLGRIVLQVRES